jgi:hypothetical protein
MKRILVLLLCVSLCGPAFAWDLYQSPVTTTTTETQDSSISEFEEANEQEIYDQQALLESGATTAPSPSPDPELDILINQIPIAAPPAMGPRPTKNESNVLLSPGPANVIRGVVRDLIQGLPEGSDLRNRLQTWLYGVSSDPAETMSLADVRSLLGILAQPDNLNLAIASRTIGSIVSLQPANIAEENRLPYLQWMDDRQAIEVLQHAFAAARFGADPTRNYIKTSGLRVCVAAIFYDPNTKVGLVAHIDDWTDLGASLNAMQASFQALGGNFANAQLSLVTPWESSTVLANVRQFFNGRQMAYSLYSGASAMLNLDSGEIKTFMPVPTTNFLMPQQVQDYMTDLNRRNDMGPHPLVPQPSRDEALPSFGTTQQSQTGLSSPDYCDLSSPNYNPSVCSTL